VTIYEHHGAWYTYHRQDGKIIRRRVGSSQAQAECVASLLNAKLSAKGAGLALDDILSTVLPQCCRATGSFPDSADPSIAVHELRDQFLNHHEHVLGSAISTVTRYTSATKHLISFSKAEGFNLSNDLSIPLFVQYLRSIEVAPNGHANTLRRKLRDKGIKYILETCRSMYHFGLRQRIVAANPFSDFGIGKLRVRDAKPIFVFNAAQELSFLKTADLWGFTVHLMLAKTGLRPGELVHTLIEDVDFDDGWLHVRSKSELGWSVKTGRDRRIPLVPELVGLLQRVVGDRQKGVLLLRSRIAESGGVKIACDRVELAKVVEQRVEASRVESVMPLSRAQIANIHRKVWRDAGAIPVDRVRTSFVRIAKRSGLNVTAPKSWRHTFATLLQEANVDLLVRQETLGHQPASPDAGVLGMTGTYTHTQPEIQRREIERAVCLRPQSLALIHQKLQEKTYA